MAFSTKIVLSEYTKDDGTKMVQLRAIIDRRTAKVALGFYIKESQFDFKKNRIKPEHPNATNLNIELELALKRSGDIASQYRIDGKYLTPEAFRNEYTDPTEKQEFISFFKNELELRRATISENTYKQHLTVISKLEAFRKSIHFQEITIELIQQFQNHLLKKRKDGTALSAPTVNKLLKIVKQYISDARKKGVKVKDPFEVIKIKSFASNRIGLSQAEVDKLDAYYDSPDCPPSHRKLLRYFLFSCYSGLRISDVKVITWNNISDDLLIFVPVKTKAQGKKIVVPLRPVDKKYLPEFGPGPIFDTFADQVSNRYLKEIAAHLGINKNITYHTSRHTFGSLFAEGGNIVALKQMMGHGDIKTTMGYVHTSTKNLIDAKKDRFG